MVCFAVAVFMGCSSTLQEGEPCGDGYFGHCDDGLFCDDHSDWTCQPNGKYGPPLQASPPAADVDASSNGDASSNVDADASSNGNSDGSSETRDARARD